MQSMKVLGEKHVDRFIPISWGTRGADAARPSICLLCNTFQFSLKAYFKGWITNH